MRSLIVAPRLSARLACLTVLQTSAPSASLAAPSSDAPNTDGVSSLLFIEDVGQFGASGFSRFQVLGSNPQ